MDIKTTDYNVICVIINVKLEKPWGTDEETIHSAMGECAGKD